VELRRAKEEAEGASQAKSQFLSTMSHELRSPLNAVIGFSDLLIRDSDDEMTKELAPKIHDSGKYLLAMIEEILDLDRIEAGKVTLNIEATAINDLVTGVVSSWHPRLPAEFSLSLETDPTCGVAPCDSTRIQQILNNLIDNAIKFTHEGHVTVRLVREDERVCVCVEDTGVGIGEAFQPYLFDDFKQESTGLARSHEGAGLGLAVTRRMVNLMGGTIDVESTKGEGSVFEVSFGQPVMTNGAAKKPSTPEGDRPKPCILVVEDTPEIEMLVEYMLSDAYDVMTTPHEEGAMALARQRRFDLVLMDINLGGARTGVDVMDAMRELPAYRHVPIVAMTAYALLEDRARFLEAGFDGYLSKPFTAHQAIDTIRQLLSVNGKG